MIMDIAQLKAENEALSKKLQEAQDTIESIRNGEIDALVIKGMRGNEVYTLKSADYSYRVFLEKIAQGAVTLDGSGVIQYCNSSFASMISLTPSLVVAEFFEEFVRKEDRNYFNHLWEQGWKADIKGEVSLITNNGFIPVQLSIIALRLGKEFALSILITDLTNQKKTEEQLNLKNNQLAAINLALERSNIDLQQFASVASHDLQEPLRKITTFSSSLKDKFDQDLSGSSKIYVDKIISSANRMKVLITDILSYSRLSADTSNFEMTDLKMLISELLEDFEIAIEEKKAVIVVEEMPTLPVIRGQMRQVFQNLISNALKFTRTEETPLISIRSVDQTSVTWGGEEFPGTLRHILVKDNGIGFDELYAKNIFNLFEQLNGHKYKGTGIGLAICKKIIEKHHGHISVKSKQGVGSEFIISLPLTSTAN